jgi:hypothetical protein
MTGTPPEANAEYSRATEVSERLSLRAEPPRWRVGVAVPTAVLAGGIAGALMLIASEFTTLYAVHASSSHAALQTISGGSHNDYAFVPMAVLALILAYGAARQGSRPALLALGLVGVLALVIAVAGDLPDSHASGLLGSATTHFVNASSSAGLALYLETAGAAILILTCGAGFLLSGPPAPPPRRQRPPRRPADNSAA